MRGIVRNSNDRLMFGIAQGGRFTGGPTYNKRGGAAALERFCDRQIGDGARNVAFWEGHREVLTLRWLVGSRPVAAPQWRCRAHKELRLRRGNPASQGSIPVSDVRRVRWRQAKRPERLSAPIRRQPAQLGFNLFD